MYWKFAKFYNADTGAEGGQPPATPTGNSGDGEEMPFTPAQQAKIDALIDKAFAKGAARAAKAAEKDKQTEAEKLATDRAELEAEKAKFRVQALLSKEGYVLGDDTDTALIGLFAMAPDAAESNLVALKKLIETRVNQEVDKRLKSAGQPAPRSGDNSVSVGDAINGLFRKVK